MGLASVGGLGAAPVSKFRVLIRVQQYSRYNGTCILCLGYSMQCDSDQVVI